MTVKYIADISAPIEYTGYLVDGNLFTSLGYAPVDEWMVEGNVPDDAFTFEELQLGKMNELSSDVLANSKPRVFVALEDGSEIYIWGSRNDQFDIGDRYELMKEDSIPSIYLKDADDGMQFLGHLDIKRCYKAITIRRQNILEYQWSKEAEIMACTTQAELDLIIWTIP